MSETFQNIQMAKVSDKGAKLNQITRVLWMGYSRQQNRKKNKMQSSQISGDILRNICDKYSRTVASVMSTNKFSHGGGVGHVHHKQKNILLPLHHAQKVHSAVLFPSNLNQKSRFLELRSDIKIKQKNIIFRKEQYVPLAA